MHELGETGIPFIDFHSQYVGERKPDNCAVFWNGTQVLKYSRGYYTQYCPAGKLCFSSVTIVSFWMDRIREKIT